MHFNKPGSSDNNNMDLLTSSSSASQSSASALASFSSSAAAPATKAKPNKATTHGINLGLWWLLFMAVILMAQQQPCECRYLPTRSHGDDLDKLRELMLQILESSNEDAGAQQRPPPNEANGNAYASTAAAAAAAAAQRANWLNKLGGSMDTMDIPRKYTGPRGIYDNGRYY